MKLAKQFTLLLLLCLPFIFTACNDDDEQPAATPEERLIGVWVLSNQDVKYFVDGQQIPSEFVEGVDITFPENATLEFKSDNSLVYTGDGETDTGTWSLSEDAKVLTINAGGMSAMPFNVQTLTENNLDVVFTYEGNEVINEQERAVRLDLTLFFTK